MSSVMEQLPKTTGAKDALDDPIQTGKGKVKSGLKSLPLEEQEKALETGTPTPKKTPVEQLLEFKTAGSCTPKAVTDILAAASAPEKVEIGKNAALVDWLAGQLTGAPRNDLLDQLFAVTDELAVLKQLFKLRYGVTVGSAGNTEAQSFVTQGGQVVEADWGPNGLKRIYEVFKGVPLAHVQTITHLMSRGTNSTDSASGSAPVKKPFLQVTYNEGRVDESEKSRLAGGESVSFTKATDAMHPLNCLDSTTLHELGHKVDTGHVYSDKPTFRALCSWSEYDTSQADKLATDLVASMTDPMPGFTEDEKKIGTKALELTFENQDPQVSIASTVQAYDDLGLNKSGEATKYRAANQLKRDFRATRAADHVKAGQASRAAWFKEPFSYLATTQFHQAYAKQSWFSYPNSARASKLSIYQFRNPADCFAELYATYFSTTPHGSSVPDEMKKWFEKEKLHE